MVGSKEYDLCFAWEWPYDCDFLHRLDAVCQAEGLSLLQVTPTNLESVLLSLVDNEISFQVLFDRASDVDRNFKRLILWARQQGVLRINKSRLARRSWDKAAMHKVFTSAGLKAPQTIVLPSCEEAPQLLPVDLEPLGSSFVIKPAHGGGGYGVMTGATSWDQVLAARQKYPTDRYLLQTYVEPASLDGRPAWFRVIYCAGEIFVSWWDPLTHIYTPISREDQRRLKLDNLSVISLTIAGLCQLELFSTEIALTQDGQFMLVDYVNDPIDLRSQSITPEGVPDIILDAIARGVAGYAAAHCQSHRLPEYAR